MARNFEPCIGWERRVYSETLVADHHAISFTCRGGSYITYRRTIPSLNDSVSDPDSPDVLTPTVYAVTIVLSVVGATGSTIVTYLLPGFCFFRLCPDARHSMARLAMLQCGMGLVLMPLCLTLIFVK